MITNLQLRMARAGLDISQKETSDLLQVSVGSIARLEKGPADTPISSELALRFAILLTARGARFEMDGKTVALEGVETREYDVLATKAEARLAALAVGAAMGASIDALKVFAPDSIGKRDLADALRSTKAGAARRQFEKLIEEVEGADEVAVADRVAALIEGRT